MNNIIKDVEELKELIKESDEYKDYTKSKELLDNNSNVKNLINKITSLQKDIVHKQSKKIDVKDKNKELDSLYESLYLIKEYNDYISSSKKLNILISDVQKRFNIYFDSLVIEK
ncbi:MAG: YlbF family regulator [Bacilli bacterium]|nr:YlbF family regulator [Bacilli bacterium]